MKFVYISDFFYPETLGGAEQNDDELLNLLESRGHEVVKIKSDSVTADIVDEHIDSKFIISNFVFLFNRVRDYIQENCDYILYTHDHQYLITRDPSPYKEMNYVAPSTDLKHVDFYRNSLAVICQSALHAEIVYRNLHLDQIYSVGGNLWKEEVLDMLEELSGTEKQDKASIMMSQISHKNTKGAIDYCNRLNIDYELLMPASHKDFLQEMSQYNMLVFFPQTVETLSRIVCEARMMNCKVRTNSNIGAASEPWFMLKGKELIDVFRKKRLEIPELVEVIFENNSNRS